MGPVLGKARNTINLWKTSTNPTPVQTEAVYHDIIVDFGAGARFVWSKTKTVFDPKGTGFNLVKAERVLGYLTSIATHSGHLDKFILEYFKMVAGIHGLGSISYPSKILRCFDDRFVVLDSVLQGYLNYPNTVAGYIDFRNHCESVRDSYNGLHPSCQISTADVESGLFEYYRGLGGAIRLACRLRPRCRI